MTWEKAALLATNFPFLLMDVVEDTQGGAAGWGSEYLILLISLLWIPDSQLHKIGG